jgi:type VI secretion system protein ImpH
MAAQSGTQSPDVITDPAAVVRAAHFAARVIEELCNEPWNYQFFQTVRLLERFGAGKPVGKFETPTEEAVRFSANPALVFPPSENHSLDWPEGEQPELSVNFMGLIGPLGILPITYTEWINDRMRARDNTLRAFLDLFHHRLISLFYQAWEKYRFPVAFERDRDDRFTRYLLDFLGLGTPGLRHRFSVPDEALVFYTGLLSLQPRSTTALRQVLQDYFGVPVEIEQFVGTWRPVSEADQTEPGNDRNFSEQLSLGALAGDEVWDQQTTARLLLGPLTLAQYLDFLPIGTAYEPLNDLANLFTHREVDFEIQLILRREETPGILLDYRDSGQPMLGWTTWLKSAPMTRDPADTILQLQDSNSGWLL